MIALTPLIPDGDQAREWAQRELADPAYELAQPTWFDRAAQTVRDAIASLFSPSVPPEWAAVLALIVGGLVIGLVIVALVAWGVPRGSRAGRTGGTVLFGDVEDRTAAGLRSAAAAAQRREDWDQAVVLRFRAAARGVDERGILDLTPGTTAGQFATAAEAHLPGSARGRIRAAAGVFDDVRYLGRTGTPEGYRLVVEADELLQREAVAPVQRQSLDGAIR